MNMTERRVRDARKRAAPRKDWGEKKTNAIFRDLNMALRAIRHYANAVRYIYVYI